MKKLSLHISRSKILDLLALKSSWILMICILGIVVYFSLFLKTNLLEAVYFPAEVSESEIIARQQKVNTKLFDQSVNAFEAKTSAKTGHLNSLTNPFTSL